MQRRTMGQGGFSCSAIGYGAMSLAGIYGNATQSEGFATLDGCLDRGITHFDTANVYGMGLSEEMINAWFQTKPASVRQSITIATKAGITQREDGTRWHRNDRAYLEAELDKSLKRLGQDSVDLFYIHRRDPDMSFEELGQALKGLIETGKCRFVGVSEVAPASLERLVDHCPIAAVQSEYSLSTRSPELGLVQKTRELGAALVAFCPVGRGLLTDTTPTSAYIKASGFLAQNPRFSKENLAYNEAQIKRFRELAADMGVPAAALAVAWVLAQGDHIIPIPGTRNPEHLGELTKAADLSLTQDDLARIEQVLPLGWAAGDRYSVAQWDGPEKYG